MTAPVKNAQQLVGIAAREERARDATLAMQDYLGEARTLRERTANLRAARLVRDAEELKNPKAEPKPKTTTKTKTSTVEGAAKDNAPPVRIAKPRST
jgi:hypothetical protein